MVMSGKGVRKMDYGLLGKKLNYSFSKEIHESISDIKYDLLEKDEIEFAKFIQKKKFKGLNITNPYKEEVIKYLDYVSKEAKNIAAVNTVINRDGKLYGYNTDILGFEFLTKDIDFRQKKVVILGTGGTAKTIKYDLSNLASEIYVISRSKDNYYHYDDLRDLDYDILINCTPIGVYPNIYDNFIEIKDIEAYIDVNYNPLKTELLLQAEEKGIKIYSGLLMLVAQAVYANRLFFAQKLTDLDCLINSEYKRILREKQNIVLIGMPTVGKSEIANLLANKTKRVMIDTDLLIEEAVNMKTYDYINKYGIDLFRRLEKKVIKKISLTNSKVIALGGGSILDYENVHNLRHNSILVFINKSYECLNPSQSRPLSDTPEKLKQLYKVRLPLYKKYSDFIIENDDNETIVNEIIFRILGDSNANSNK